VLLLYAVATDSDFRIFYFALYSPPVNGHCLDTSVRVKIISHCISHFTRCRNRTFAFRTGSTEPHGGRVADIKISHTATRSSHYGITLNRYFKHILPELAA